MKLLSAQDLKIHFLLFMWSHYRVFWNSLIFAWTYDRKIRANKREETVYCTDGTWTQIPEAVHTDQRLKKKSNFLIHKIMSQQ